MVQVAKGVENPGRDAWERRNLTQNTDPPPRHVSYGDEAQGRERHPPVDRKIDGVTPGCRIGPRKERESARRAPGRRKPVGTARPPVPAGRTKRRTGRAEPMTALRETGGDPRSAAQFQARAGVAPQGAASEFGTSHVFEGPQRTGASFVVGLVGPRVRFANPGPLSLHHVAASAAPRSAAPPLRTGQPRSSASSRVPRDISDATQSLGARSSWRTR